MKRILAISDIHGCHDEFCELLNKVKYIPNQDKLILLGDYVDRGYKSKDVIEMIMGLVNEYGAVAIVGNHDQLLLDWLLTDDYFAAHNYFANGGLQTLESYCGLNWNEDGLDIDGAKDFILTHYKHHVDFLNSLPYYHEDDKHIFVHAGIHSMYADWKETTPEEMIWIRDVFFNNPTYLDKTVVFGHTPCLHLHGVEDIWMGEDKIGIDGGCAYGFQLNCLEINENGYNTYFVNSKTRRKFE